MEYVFRFIVGFLGIALLYSFFAGQNLKSIFHKRGIDWYFLMMGVIFMIWAILGIKGVMSEFREDSAWERRE